MTARELYEHENKKEKTFEDFLRGLTHLMQDEGGVDYISFPDTEITDEMLEEVGFWL